jgi:predicted RNA-binding Zn-ribbon protein involved in translation (DUF1610 family)
MAVFTCNHCGYENITREEWIIENNRKVFCDSCCTTATVLTYTTFQNEETENSSLQTDTEYGKVNEVELPSNNESNKDSIKDDSDDWGFF